MKKILAAVVLASVIAVSVTGCKFFQANNTAFYTGIAVHQAYTKIAEKQSAEFKANVEELWVSIDSITNATQIGDVYIKITEVMDKLVADKGLDSKQVNTIITFRKLFDDTISKVIGAEAAKQEEAIKWLSGVREGIRTMRNMECEDCKDCTISLPGPEFD